MLTNHITSFYQNTLKTVQRFPLPTFISLLLFYCLLCLVDTKNRGFLLPNLVLQNGFKFSRILLCSLLLFIIFKLFIETQKVSLKNYYFLGMTLFSAMVWYLYTRSTLHELIFTSNLMVAGLLLILLATPCFYQKSFTLQSWTFIYQLCFHLCFSILTTIFLYISLILLLRSSEQLFEVGFHKHLHTDLAYIIFTIVFPVLAMASIPKPTDRLEPGKLKNLNTVLNYLAAPMFFIYSVVLFAYLLKIIITWNLPKNNIVLLTSIFGCSGIITYFYGYPMRHDQSIIGAFSRNFFKFLPVTLVAFSVNIGVRIYHYGITESRYLSLLFLIWLIFSTGISFLRKFDEVPKFVLTSLPVLLLAASFGPWSAVNLSLRSQCHRLTVLLEKNQILIAGKIQKPRQKLVLTDQRTIGSMIDYLINREKIDCLRCWFTPEQIAHINKTPRSRQKRVIMQALGIEHNGL